jgi:hypothetical protein
MSDLEDEDEDEPPITPLHIVAAGSMSDQQRFQLALEEMKKKHKAELEKDEKEHKEIHEKFLKLTAANEVMSDMLLDYEQSDFEKRHVYNKVEATLVDLQKKYEDAQQRGLAREEYITQMHHLNDELNRAIQAPDKGKDRQREILCQIERTKEQAMDLQSSLSFVLGGFEDVFNWHMDDQEDLLEALNVIEEHIEDENKQLWWLYDFLEDVEETAWNLDVPAKEAIYAAELDLARGVTSLERRERLARLAIDDSPSSDQVAVEYPSGSFHISDGDAPNGIALLCLEDEEVEADSDGDIVMCDAEAAGQTDTGQHRLYSEWRDAQDLPDPDSPEPNPRESRPKRRAERLKWNESKVLLSPITSPLTSPLPVRCAEQACRMNIEATEPYLSDGRPPPPPSKRRRLNRPRFPVWDSYKEGILARESPQKERPLANGGLRQIFTAISDPTVTLHGTIRDKQGRSNSVGDCSQGSRPGTYAEADEPKADHIMDGYIIIHYSLLWNCLADWVIGVHKAVLAKPMEYATSTMGIAMMMWLAYYLSLYEKWMVANNTPLALSWYLDKMSISEIGPVEKVTFGVNRWLDYERPWTG